MRDLPVHQSEEPLLQVERRDHQFFQAGIIGQTGERVEDNADFLSHFRVARQETEVRIRASCPRMIIASAEMDVVPQAIAVPPDNEERLAMRLQSDDAINDVGAGFLERARPLNIDRFIETRAQFHDRGDLFARVRRFDERFHNRRITARPIQGHLECEHLRIARRGLDQFYDRIETFVGMMEQDVLLAQHFEDIRFFWQGRIARRLKRTVLQVRERVVHHERRQMRHGQRPIEFVNVHVRQIEKFEEQLAEIARAIGFHFETDGVAAARPAQFLFDGAKEIFRFFFLDVEIAVARDAKGVDAVED